MRKALTLTFAVVLASTMAVAAFAADNTLGTWKYNTAKSKGAPGTSPITNLTVTREASEGGIKSSAKGARADGTKIDYGYNAKYDGKVVPVMGSGSAWDSVAIKQVDDNTFTESRTNHSTKYHTRVRVVVSADGKTMTLSAKGTDSDGKAMTTKVVLDKQ
jgi:hypothetical protein